MRNLLLSGAVLRLPVFQADTGAGGGGDAPPAGGGDAPPAKWWETPDFSPEEQQWLSARGLAEDDVAKVVPKLVKGHRAAEQRIGKGLDAIMDRPAKDQPYAEWARANAAALGLPEAEDGYAVQPPEFWPKDLPWDADLEAKARKIGFEKGATYEQHQAYVELYAELMKTFDEASKTGMQQAQEAMMQELQRDFGDQTPAVLTRAKQGAQMVAEKAGLSADALTAISQTLADKTGDAGVIRLFNAIAEMAGEDTLLGRGAGQAPMTKAEAQAEISRRSAPDGDWFKANATGNRAEIARLKPDMDRLFKLAAG